MIAFETLPLPLLVGMFAWIRRSTLNLGSYILSRPISVSGYETGGPSVEDQTVEVMNQVG